MDRHSIVFVTDERQKYLAQCLGTRIDTVMEKEAAKGEFAREVFATAQAVVFPIPAEKIANKMPGTLKLKEELTNRTMVFGGKFPESWKKEFDERGITCYDLMEDDTVTLQNAGITAEAVVAEVLRHGLYSIKDQKIIITGYGKCARAAAHKLLALGAKVTVLARSVEARKLARSEGCCAMDFAYGPQEAYGTRTFINTVPACVVTDRIFREMHKDVLVLDIASAPGGCDLEAAKAHGIQVIPALGLPGIYTPRSSAMILSDAIQKKMRSERGVKEEKSWIFQILPSDMA